MIQGLGDLINIQNGQQLNAKTAQNSGQGFDSVMGSKALASQQATLSQPKGLNRLAKLNSIEDLLTQFLQEMQDQAGVQPELSMQTLENMDLTILNLKPEDALNKLYSNLPVKGEQAEKAGEVFLNLIEGLKKVTGNGKEVQKDLRVEILSAQEMLKRKRVQNLDKMNNSFFGPQNAKLDSAIQGDLMSKVGLPNQMPQNQVVPGKEMAVTFINQGSSAQGVDVSNLSDFFKAAENEASSLKSLSQASSPLSNSSVNLAEDLVQKLRNLADASKIANKSVNAYANNTAQTNSATQSATQGSPISTEMILQSMGMTQGDGAEYSEGQFNQSQGQPNMGMTSGMISGQGMTAESAGPKFMIETPQLTPQQKVENVGEIVKQANVLVKDGGGEMTMQLRPEGVGEIKLKVMVNDGQVNVQMVANNRQTKALIEDGIADLRLQLANNKLIVDDVKVDMADDLAKNFEFNQEEANRQEQREFARQFMSNYREERDAFRNNLLGLPNRKFGSPEPSDDIQPIVQTNSQKSRLHVVA